MRIRIARVVIGLVILLNLLALYFIWIFVTALGGDAKSQADKDPKTLFTLSDKSSVSALKSHGSGAYIAEKSLTVVIRSFEHFERDVAGTILSFLLLFPKLPILVVSDTFLYPPLHLELDNLVNSSDNVKLLNMQLDLRTSFMDRNIFTHINTKYVLFVPDSTRIISKSILQTMVSKIVGKSPSLVAIPISNSKPAECLKINLDIREWSIQYEKYAGKVCDAVIGKHVILVKTQTLKNLPDAFLLPFPNALYIQTATKNLKVKLIKDVGFSDGKLLFQSQHAQWKVEQLNMYRQQQMFQYLRLKKVIRENSLVEWYGCTRETPRCFGTVVADMPSYLWEGKWTPPCCLSGLRQTARHVFKELDAAGIRYWLEGGSLLGAMRTSDILPWDYDVDIGMYQDDISRCTWLVRARSHQVVDNDGFVWEKASEGDFFRVQFSAVNHLHVDIFPFFSRNGTMTKNTWFPTHKQDCEFPENFLHPMASIEFVGRQVPAPNNIRDFLELKFGKGVIENPQYPNSQKLKFSPKETPELGLVSTQFEN